MLPHHGRATSLPGRGLLSQLAARKPRFGPPPPRADGQRPPPAPNLLPATSPAATASAAPLPTAASAGQRREGKFTLSQFSAALGLLLASDEEGKPRPSIGKACLAAGLADADGKAACRETLRGYAAIMDRESSLLGAAQTLELRRKWLVNFAKPEKGNPDLLARKIFDDDELLTFDRTIRLYSQRGLPLQDGAVAGMMRSYAAQKHPAGDPERGGAPYEISDSFLARFYDERPHLKNLKSSNVDLKRARKATPELRAAWFELVEAGIARQHARHLDPDNNEVRAPRLPRSRLLCATLSHHWLSSPLFR